jgi:putative ABC transport system permease protein
MTSGLSREETRLIADAPGIARNEGAPFTSAELFVMVNLPKRSTGTDANVPMRGVGKEAMAVRSDFQILEGRNIELGKNEVIVGIGAARSFAGLDVGKKVKIGMIEWDVVGIFSGGGGSAESEIWTDSAVLQPAYNRTDGFQSVYAKLISPEDIDQFKSALETNPQLKVKAMLQSEWLSEQSTMLTGFVQSIGYFITGLMALGALFGALNTMYSAVAARTREIATLRALGFGASPIVLSVMFESLVLSLAGGIAGAAAAYFALDGYQASTINWQSFSQIAFAFTVTPALLASAIVWAAAIGVLGGLFPAIRAARLPIATALREI